jgi:hypothetical protein
MAESGRIFICYRREETAYSAGWLFDRLADRFEGQIFKDVDSIEPGDDWVEVITTVVGSCDVLLALIGDRWLTITDEDGRRRLDDPDDFVLLEIEAALTRNVRVIPILVEGARMPRADELPPSLATLARRQALVLSPTNFDTSRLVRVLNKTLAEVRIAQEDAAAISAPAGKAPDRGATELSEAPEQRKPDESSPIPSVPPAAPAADREVLPDSPQVSEPGPRTGEAGPSPDEDQLKAPDSEATELSSAARRGDGARRRGLADDGAASGPASQNPPATAEPDEKIPGTEPGPSTDTTDTLSADTNDGGSVGRRWRHSLLRWRTSGIALGVVAALVIAGFVWQAHRDEGPGLVLPKTEMLMGVTGQGIFRFDSATGDKLGQVINDATANSPGISEDRRWMVYLTGEPGLGVPHLARVDGSADTPLLGDSSNSGCPSTKRPAFSPDGGLLALICYDADGTSVSLEIVDRHGNLVHTPYTGDDLLGTPTWTGDGRVVFMRQVARDDPTTTLWVISASGDDEQPTAVTSGKEGSDSQPDWSSQGLLFLRKTSTPDKSSDVFYQKTLKPRASRTMLSSSGTAQFPTWAPQGVLAVAWQESGTQDETQEERTLYVKTLDDGPPVELNTGVYGAPAWGSR